MGERTEILVHSRIRSLERIGMKMSRKSYARRPREGGKACSQQTKKGSHQDETAVSMKIAVIDRKGVILRRD